MSPRAKNGVRVAVRQDGEVVIHAASSGVGGDYDTLCGVDANDASIGHFPVQLPVGKRINCDQCFAIYLQATRYTQKDFSQ